jgi:hypothetical protein
VKKFSVLFAILLLAALLASCVAKEYENFEELDDGARLQKGDIVYSFYAALPKDSLRGKQIGIVDDDKKHKVFEVKGFSSDEWVIEYYDVIMSTYNVYKADTVTEVPDELKQ